MVWRHNIPLEKSTPVQLKTILNHVERHKSFVYQDARWADPATKMQIEIPIEPRANGRAICSGCGQRLRFNRWLFAVLELGILNFKSPTPVE